MENKATNPSNHPVYVRKHRIKCGRCMDSKRIELTGEQRIAAPCPICETEKYEDFIIKHLEFKTYSKKEW